MTDHAPDCSLNVYAQPPTAMHTAITTSGGPVCTCAAKERARIAELEQALGRAEAELSQLKERVGELPEVDGPHHYRPGSESFWIGDPRTNRFVEFDGGRCYADGKAFPIADVAWMGAALLAAAREAKR